MLLLLTDDVFRLPQRVELQQFQYLKLLAHQSSSLLTQTRSSVNQSLNRWLKWTANILLRQQILLTWIIWSCFHLCPQVLVEPVSAAASIVDVPLPPPPVSVLDSAAEVVSAEPTPVLTQPLIQQVVDAAPTATEILQIAATEQSLAELGLAGYTPVGLIQNLLEFMHVDIGLPWWGAIVVGQQTVETYSWRTLFKSLMLILVFIPRSCAGTLLARLAVFPVIVKGQREAAKLNNVLPEMTKLTNRMNEAKQSGNKFECKTNEIPFLPDYCSFATVGISQAAVLCYSWQSLRWPDLVPEETWCESSPWVPGSSSTGQFIFIPFLSYDTQNPISYIWYIHLVFHY